MLFLPRLCKRSRHDEREHDRRFRVHLVFSIGQFAGSLPSSAVHSRDPAHLDAVPPRLDLPPTDRLVRPRPRVAAVKLLRRVHEHGALGAVAHQARVGDVVLDQAAAEDDHAGAGGVDGDVVEAADVARDGDVEDGGGGAEGVEVEHVAEGAVGEGGAEDGDGVAVGPVEDGGGVGDLGAEAGGDGAGGPDEAVGVVGAGAAGGFLLGEHGVEDGEEPVFEGAVVAVGDDEVADAVEAAVAEGGAVGGEGGEVGGCEAFDEVLFDAAGGGDDGGDVGVLDEVAEGGAEARGDEVGGVAEEEGGSGAGVRVAEGAHVVDDADGVGDGAGLEAHGGHVGDELGDGDVAVGVVVEFDAGDWVGAGGDGGGGFEDGVGGEGRGFGGWGGGGGWGGHDGWWCRVVGVLELNGVEQCFV